MNAEIRLRQPGGLALALSTRGATWLSCEVPLPGGAARSVILQRAQMTGDAADQAYVGATIGRYANRIAQARIASNGHTWPLAPNPGSRHQLHGGPGGFHVREWQVDALDDTAVTLSLVSPDGDQGYPGRLDAQVIYSLTDALTIEMEAVARVTARSPMCLTNHAYFNLDGAAGDVRRHHLRVAARRYLPVDEQLIPLGTLLDVHGTGFDFRAPKTLLADWLRDPQQRHGGGYDHAFLLDAGCRDLRAPAAVLVSADGTLAMEIRTTLPALQLYAGQFLRGLPFAGVALEPQFLPDSPNHPEWPQPSCWLEPGAVYRHTISYTFVAGD